ncbi:MAG: heme-binding protein [Verrucomicrobiae bacterium]|nr:heme-binding protein [Verrucomicrobiae bacterium]
MKQIILGAGFGVIAICAGAVLWFTVANSRAVTETPKYIVVEKDGDFELRDYPRLELVSTGMSADDRGMDGAFGRLFRFITGANEGERKIAMTTPVLVEGVRGEEGRMSFIVPKDVAGSAPKPRDAAVGLRSHEGGRFAVLRFKGGRTAEVEREAMAALKAELERRKIATEGDPFFAFYDPPWTPTFLRRNEILVRVADKSS